MSVYQLLLEYRLSVNSHCAKCVGITLKLDGFITKVLQGIDLTREEHKRVERLDLLVQQYHQEFKYLLEHDPFYPDRHTPESRALMLRIHELVIAMRMANYRLQCLVVDNRIDLYAHTL